MTLAWGAVLTGGTIGCADDAPRDGTGTLGPGLGGVSTSADATEGPVDQSSGGAEATTTASTGAVADDAGTDDDPKFDLGETPDGGGPTPGDCDPELTVTLRDFPSSHPDFEYVIAVDPGIVAADLGVDGKPVYAGGSAGTTTGQANFDQWYRDVAGVNQTIATAIALVDQGDGSYVYDSAAFFPLDGQGFGNEGNSHNYHFTLELHAQFTYEGGEVFTFRGDDDLFTFVNGKLAIDLGGVHGPLMGAVDFDAMAGELGIEVGGTYDIDFFFAERHTSESNFRIETTIGCFQPPG